MEETIGKRIAQLRQAHGWTQQIIALRLAMSRVAVSHIEMDLIIPGERTITLLAGLFKMSPQNLVQGTTYPQAKAERLPEITPWYTKLEYQLALLQNDLLWLTRLENQPEHQKFTTEIWVKWVDLLDERVTLCFDEEEKAMLAEARRALLKTCKG